MNMRVTLSVGGSLICPDDIDWEFVNALAVFLKKTDMEKIFIVAGGGKTARKYVSVCRNFNIPETILDEIGILASRLNAYVIISVLYPDAPSYPPTNFNDALLLSRNYKFVVMGGTHPGHTTDAVAVMLAEHSKCDLVINLTNVDGIYNKDPSKYPDAHLIKEMSHDELLKISYSMSRLASTSGAFDTLAAEILKRSKISLISLNGKKFDELERALKGDEFIGTKVR